ALTTREKSVVDRLQEVIGLHLRRDARGVDVRDAIKLLIALIQVVSNLIDRLADHLYRSQQQQIDRSVGLYGDAAVQLFVDQRIDLNLISDVEQIGPSHFIAL